MSEQGPSGEEQVKDNPELLAALDAFKAAVGAGDDNKVREAMARVDAVNRGLRGLPLAIDEAESSSERITRRGEEVASKMPPMSPAESAWLEAQTPEHTAGLLREIEEKRARALREVIPGVKTTEEQVEDEGKSE